MTFQEHFGSKADHRWLGCILDHLDLVRDGVQRLEDITKPFSEEEIKAANWGLGVNKLPGPDAFSMFYFYYF